MRVDGQARAARPDKSVLLRASAGSGKTRALILRLMHLLFAGARPDEAVAITFTEKAAAQMKEKFYQALYEAAWEGSDARGLLGLDPGDMPYPLTAGPESVLRELTARPDALKVLTIHAFCLGLLRRFPLEAGLPAEFRVMDESEIPLLREAAADGLFESIEGGLLDEELKTLLDCGLSLNSLRELIVEGLDKRGQTALVSMRPHAMGADSDPEIFRREASGLIESGEIQGLSGELAVLMKKAGTFEDGAVISLERLSALKNPDDFPEIFDGLREFFYTEKMEFRARPPLTKKDAEKAAGRQGADALKARFDSLYLPLREMVNGLALAKDKETGARALRALLGLYGEAERIYTENNRRDGLVDYDDLEIYALRLLSGPDGVRLLYRLEAKTLHYLVDEFQDTGEFQWRIIETLNSEAFSGEGASGPLAPTFFAVGDVKQSIYRFRKANYKLTERLRRKMEVHMEPSRRDFPELDINFRSAPGVAEVVDKIFAELLGDGYGGMTAFRKAGGSVKLRVAPQGLEAEALAREVSDARSLMILDGQVLRPARYGDMAVLIRSRAALSKYERALRRLGVPFKVVGGVGFFYQDEIQTLLAILAHLENPADKLSLAAALKSPLFRLSDAGIEPLYDKGMDAISALAGISPDAHRLISGWRGAVGVVPLGALVERVVRDSAAVFSFGLSGGPAAVLNIEKLISIARDFDRRGGGGLPEFTEWVKAYKDKADLATADINLPHYQDYLSIMTVHAAKGLEFPVVFLPGTSRKTGRDMGGFIVGDGEADVPAMAVRTKGLLGDNPQYRALKEYEEGERKKEAARLLYVGMTRAMDHLIILSDDGKPDEESFMGLLSGAGIMDILKPAPDDPGAYYYPGPPEPGAVPILPASGILLPEDVGDADYYSGPEDGVISPGKSMVPGFGEMTGIGKLPPSRGLSFVSPSMLSGEAVNNLLHGGAPDPLALSRGSLIHRAMECIGTGREYSMSRLAMDYPEIAALGKAAAGVVAKKAEEAVAKLMRDPELSRIISPGDNKFFELPLLLRRGDEIISGFADLIIIEDGKALVIDFKTGYADIPPEMLLEAFKPQLDAYKEAVAEAFGTHSVETFLLLVDIPRLIPAG
ncbi:MAG: UvrD-helicase domain-containing protein [Nitrospirota bacterium]